MAAQKQKKLSAVFFAFLNTYYSKNQLIKNLNSLDSSRPYKKLLENPKIGHFSDFFLPGNDFKIS